MSDVSSLSPEPVVRKKRSVAPVAIAVSVVLIGLAVVGSSTSGGAGMYNYTLAQLERDGTKVDGKEIKVAGKVKKGSVRGQPASDTFRFDVEDNAGHALTIAYTKLLPDPFEEGRDAIVAGKLERSDDGARLLRASSLTVKCPSRYGDAESMSEADRQKYYQTDYKKHQEAQKKP
jgi:cytochrome c-type biogenesis protein CcmE